MHNRHLDPSFDAHSMHLSPSADEATTDEAAAMIVRNVFQSGESGKNYPETAKPVSLGTK